MASLSLSRRYKKVGPDEAMVVYGRNRYTVITGGARFIYPVVEAVRYMDIGAKSLDFVVERAMTKSGVPVDIELSAVVKVSTESSKLNRAVQQWMSKTVAEVMGAAQNALVGGTRSAASQWELETISADRDGFASKVRELTLMQFADLGLELVTFQLREIRDSSGVLDALGQRKAADAKLKGAVAAAVAGSLPLDAAALDPKAARRADVGRRLLQQLPDLTDEQVDGLEKVLGGPPAKVRPREVDASTEGD